MQTWAASLQKISAEWSVRQVLLDRQHEDFFAASADEKPAKEKKDASKPEKKGRTGGFGGPWRAYVHLNHAGRRFSRSSLAALGTEFRSLSARDRAFYEELGARATLASRAGFKSFGDSRGLEDQESSGSLAGAIQGGDALVPVSESATSGTPADLVPHCSEHFDLELRRLNRSLRKQAAQQREQLRQQEKLRLEHQEQVLSNLNQFVSGVPPEQSRLALRSRDSLPPAPDPSGDGDVASAGEVRPSFTAVAWSAPSADLAKARFDSGL